MPLTERGWTITPDELRSWIVEDTEELLVVDKPGLVVCHPSKDGPWSSLIGACREYLGLERLHMPSRLDRETSGVVVFAKNPAAASRLQTAIERRHVRKTYWAVLCGTMAQRQEVNQQIGRDQNAEFAARQRVVDGGGGCPAVTVFEPVAWGGGYTLARVVPLTGRQHQIRVHAAWLGHSVAGDKLYGPDPGLMMEFVTQGFTPRLDAALPLRRHALHAAEVVFESFQTQAGRPVPQEAFRAPFASDLVEFCREKMGVSV